MPLTRRESHTAAPAYSRALSLALAVALIAPSAALASHLPSDRIGGVALSAGAVPASAAPDFDAPAGILVLGPDRALWSRGAEAERAMASTTKLMTAILVLESGDLDETVTVSKQASGVEWAIGLQPGEKVTVRTLLEYLLVASSNDAAIALAEHEAGSIPAFVSRMNEKAAELDLAETRFVNPHGLDTAGHYSSPSDLAILFNHAMKSAEVRRIVLMRSVSLPAFGKRKAKTVKATDELLGKYDGLVGGKTGFTAQAKYSFVARAERSGVSLTAVVMGSRSNASRFAEARRLFDWGFEHVALHELSAADGTVARVPIAENPAFDLPVRVADATSVPVFDLDGQVSQKAQLDERVKLPVYKGMPLGTIDIIQGGRTVASFEAVAAQSLASAEETVGRVPVSDYLDRTVLAKAGPSSKPVRQFNPSQPVHRRVDIDERVKAPVARGAVLGHIEYVQGDTVVANVPIIAAEKIAAPGFFESISVTLIRGWRSVVGGRRMATLELVGS